MGATELTEEHKKMIFETWKVVNSDEKKKLFAAKLFFKLFTDYPETQSFFRTLKDLDIEKMDKNPKLIAHGLRVVAAINNLVENVNDPDVFVEIVKNTARSHGGTKVTKKHFEELGPVLVATLGDILGEQLTPTAQEGWVLAYTLIVQVISAEYDEMEKEKAEN